VIARFLKNKGLNKMKLQCTFFAFGLAVCTFAAPIKHTFVAIDEGKGNLLYVNESDSSANWIVPIGKTSPRDMQLVGKNRILIGHDGGYTEFDLSKGKILKDVSSFSGTTSARRLPNGHTLITGVNLSGSTGVVMLDVDSLNAVKKKTIYPGDYCRLVRQTAGGTFLFARDTMIQEGDSTGSFFWKARIAGFSHAWKGVRLTNGNTLMSAGYGAFMVEVDKAGTIVWKFGAAGSVPTAVAPFFYGMFQLLKNGNVVVANWQGHGDGHGASGIQLLEFDKTGALVWQWSKAGIISSLQGVCVLDSLNTALLHDERNGVMEPVSPATASEFYRAPFSNSCQFKIVRSGHSFSLFSSLRRYYDIGIYTSAGTCVTECKGTGTATISLPQSGFYVFKDRSDKAQQLKSIIVVK
jgi:hypothetical protein